MSNPDVSGVGPNWYLGGGWPSGTIATTSSAYATALADLQAKSTAYLAAKNALITAMAGSSASAVSSAKTAFDTAADDLETALTTMQTRTASLGNAQTSAETNIDGKLDDNMTQFAVDLAGVMNQQLTLPETVSNDLDVQFAAADANRVSVRGPYLSAITSYFTAQNNLNVERNNFQTLNDELLSLKAQKRFDELNGASPVVIAADQAAIDAKQAQVDASAALIVTLTSTRDSRLTTLQGAAQTYKNALDAEIAILNQAALLMHTTATEFLDALKAAKQGAIATEQAAIAASQAADQALYNDLLSGFPTSNTSVQTQTQIIQDAYLLTMNQINNSTLAEAPNLTQISLPALPAAGQMSISQLMRFLTLVQVLLDDLIREIRRTDSQVNQMRLSIFGAAGSVDSAKATQQAIWGNILQAADTAYNIQVIKDNQAASKASVDAVNYIKSHAGLINGYINDLNDEIDDQNDNGVATVTALNSAVQMAIDEYKVNLWADHGKLDDFQNKLATAVTNLASSDPLKAPLDTVRSNSLAVINDLKTISGLLSVRPIDEAAIAAAQAQLATDEATLNSSISALPPADESIQSVLSGLTGVITSVKNDQTKLFDAIHNAELSAASALNTQVTSESTRLATYSQNLADVLAALSPTDANFTELSDLQATIPAVVGALNTLSTHLSTPPVDLSVIAADKAALETALAALDTARGAITLSSLNGPATSAVRGIDEVVPDMEGTIESLTTYTTSIHTATSIPPTLPDQVQQVLMPAPIQLEDLSTINAGAITIPPGLPTPGVKSNKKGITQAPPTVNMTSVDSLNKQIHLLNQQLAPILDRLHADGHNDIQLIPPLYIRPYVQIRDPSIFFDVTVFQSLFDLLSQIIDAENAEKSSVENPPTNALFAFADLFGKPSGAAMSALAQGVGSGTGLSGATLASSSGTIAKALTSVLDSTDFETYIRGILQKTGLVAGLAALGKLQTTPATTGRSQFGVVEPVTTTPAAAGGLTVDQQKAALQAGIVELVATIENVPALKEDLLAILKTGNLEGLDQEAINQLLSLLLFLLQLIALLFAAVAAAAGGGETRIDTIVQRAFGAPEQEPLAALVQDLRTLGITALPAGLTPAEPQFLPIFFRAIEPALLPPEREALVNKLVAIGVTIPTGVPVGEAIERALVEAPIDVSNRIRQELTKAALDEAERLKAAIIADETRRPSLTDRINQIAVAESGKTLPSDKIKEILAVLQNEGPQIPGISAEERNHLVLAILSGIVTPDQARGIVQEFVKETTLTTKPEAVTLLEPQPVAGKPGELPDVNTLIAVAIKALSKQTTDNNFVQEVVTRFADSVRDQKDFYKLSLSLILDPANTYVKNFSIVTRQTTGHDTLGPLTQIPVSG